MAFRHRDHKHDHAAEARVCEQALRLLEQSLGATPAPEHGPGDPCGCGTYDRCHFQRLRDAAAAPTRNAAIRAYARAYND